MHWLSQGDKGGPVGSSQTLHRVRGAALLTWPYKQSSQHSCTRGLKGKQYGAYWKCGCVGESGANSDLGVRALMWNLRLRRLGGEGQGKNKASRKRGNTCGVKRHNESGRRDRTRGWEKVGRPEQCRGLTGDTLQDAGHEDDFEHYLSTKGSSVRGEVTRTDRCF